MMKSSHSSVQIPIIETARLKLRGHCLEDFDACAAMWADPLVTRFVGGKPFTREETWAKVLRYVGHWSLLGFGYWAVEDRATRSFVGEVGFADFKRDLQPSLEHMPEMGWVLASSVHGRGYATEAVQAALTWGDTHFESSRTACLIHPDNLASIRVAEKCGYRELRRSTYKGHIAVVFARSNSASA
jgi:RimJ/RimL family protein N-acetyltransferase